jgi:AraC-like DNA-binding protein
MNRENPRSDPALASHARQLIRAMVDPGPRTVAEEVEQSIRLLMPAGRANISGVADSLGTNVRTLQRRLDREETSFSELLDRVRVQQVSLHFANRSLRLTDVAHLLGYSTLASFSAWYRSRFNETPTRARAKAQADRIGQRPPEMCEQTIDLPLELPSGR